MINKSISDSLMWRRAIKEFNINSHISDDDFRTIIQSAQYSPSSLGLDPWKLIAIQKESVRQAIRPYCTGAQKQLDTASHFIIISVQKNLKLESKHFENIKRNKHGLNESEYHNFLLKLSDFMNNKADLTNKRKRKDWAGKQAYIALGMMMASASLLKIDSCPIEGFFVKEVEDTLQDLGFFNSQEEEIVVMVAFGYRVKDPEQKKGRTYDETIRFIE